TDRFGEISDLAVDPGARESLSREVAQQLLVLALAATNHRCEDLEPRALGQLHHLVDDLVGSLAPDRAPAVRAVRSPDAGEEHAKVVVDLRDRPDRGARVPRRGLLVDRDGRGQALDEVHVGLLHVAEALPVAEEAIGDEPRSKIDIVRPLALINDFFDAGEGSLGEALRPMYVDYLVEHTR